MTNEEVAAAVSKLCALAKARADVMTVKPTWLFVHGEFRKTALWVLAGCHYGRRKCGPGKGRRFRIYKSLERSSVSD